MPSLPPRLSPKQQCFVDEYLIDLNATQAYLRAGYAGRGNVAEASANRLLRNVKVAAAIAIAQAERAERVHLTQDAVLQEIALLSHSDIMHYVINDYGEVQVRDGVPPSATRALASLKKKITHSEAGVTYETEVRLWNKPASLKLAADHLGINAPVKVAPTSPDGTQPYQGQGLASLLALATTSAYAYDPAAEPN